MEWTRRDDSVASPPPPADYQNPSPPPYVPTGPLVGMRPQFGVLSPRPARLIVQPNSVAWILSYATDVTTGPPQRLFRALQDSLSRFGFAPIDVFEPHIYGQAIGDTGTIEAHTTGEKGLQGITSPYVLLRFLGVLFIVIGSLLLLGALSELVSLVTLASFLEWLIPSIVLLAIGAKLARIHMFLSQMLFVHLKGEVYRSGLAAGTRMQLEVADTQRLSVISELRLSVYGSEVKSRNEGAQRRVVQSIPSAAIQSDFQAVVNDLASQILPKVVLQKTWEQTRHEFTAPTVIKEVRHEVLIRCGYCGSLNPQGTPKCSSCGGQLK